MVQNYQNEIAPIFNYGKSPKTNEKDLKIPYIQPPDWGQSYWMTRYYILLMFFWHSPIGSRTIKRIFRLGRRSVKYKTLLTLTIIIIHRISTFMSVSKNARYKFHTRKYILSKLLDTFYLASQLFGIYTLPIQNLINVFLIPHSLTFGQDDLIRPK